MAKIHKSYFYRYHDLWIFFFQFHIVLIRKGILISTNDDLQAKVAGSSPAVHPSWIILENVKESLKAWNFFAIGKRMPIIWYKKKTYLPIRGIMKKNLWQIEPFNPAFETGPKGRILIKICPFYEKKIALKSCSWYILQESAKSNKSLYIFQHIHCDKHHLHHPSYWPEDLETRYLLQVIVDTQIIHESASTNIWEQGLKIH